MIDSATVRDDAFPLPFYMTCLPTVQGISAGWADIYGPGLAGRQFPLDGITDGRYALVVSMDYADRIYETDDPDNVVELFIELSDGVTKATIIGRNRPAA